MTPRAQRILETALQLSDEDRGTLAARLINSLEPEVESDLTDEWEAEIGRRVAELEAGTAETIPWEQARKIIAGEVDEPLGR